MDLNEKQQIALLKLARKTIAHRLNTDDAGDPGPLTDPVFTEKRGAFVTLHIQSSLRGCIGYIKAVKPLKDTIAEMAVSAAFKDPRFSPLSAREYRGIDIEISVLTPVAELADINDIVVGRDGLIISRGFQSGLLLPQVPVEQGWDRDTFLEHTCYKAGLSGNAWKEPDTKIEYFSALVFSEISLGLK